MTDELKANVRREDDKVWLEGPHSTGLHTRLIASIEGCLRYLGCQEATAWIYGASGHAFFIAASKIPQISNYHSWHPHPVFELVRNLGYDIDCTFGWVDDPDFAETQAKAWDHIRSAIDLGHPCFGFNIVMPPQYQVIIGYDSKGYYSELAPDQAVPWRDVKAFPGDLAMCSVTVGEPKDDRAIVLGAFERVLELDGMGNENWGPGAYGRWLSSYPRIFIAMAVSAPWCVPPIAITFAPSRRIFVSTHMEATCMATLKPWLMVRQALATPGSSLSKNRT